MNWKRKNVPRISKQELIRRAKPKKISTEEHDTQVACVSWFDMQFRSISALLFAIPNGGWRPTNVGKDMKAEGQRPGVPDLFLAIPSGGFSGLFIEMKSRTGTVRANQKEYHRRLEAQGYAVEVCRDVETFIKIVSVYLKSKN